MLGENYHMIYKKHKHRDYLTYQVPEHWCVEEIDDCLNIYDPQGEGALTLSFYTIIRNKSLVNYVIDDMAHRFIKQFGIVLDEELTLEEDGLKKILSGRGIDSNGWRIKFWYVAHFPKGVFITYMYKEMDASEFLICDAIVNSMTFINL